MRIQLIGLLALLLLPVIKLTAQKHTALIRYDTTGNYDWDFNDSLVWTVNNIEIIPDTQLHRIGIHWPEFDTVRMKNGSRRERVIITRFSPDSSYDLIPYGCCSDIDILSRVSLSVKQERLLDSLIKKKDYYFYKICRDSIYMQIIERGTVIYKVVNASAKDSLGGTLGNEHGNFTGGVLLKNNAKTKSGIPFKLSMNSGDYCFKIRVGAVGRIHPDSTSLEYGPTTFTTKDNQNYYYLKEEYFAIEYRFLRPETLLITIDARTKKCKLEVLN